MTSLAGQELSCDTTDQETREDANIVYTALIKLLCVTEAGDTKIVIIPNTELSTCSEVSLGIQCNWQRNSGRPGEGSAAAAG